MFYTVYRVINKLTGKVYIGTHKTRNLDDLYMGSGKYLKRSIEKHGLENFTREILHVFETPEEMFAKEAELVNEDFLANENTYNLKLGGEGGWDHQNLNSDIQRAKNLKSQKRQRELDIQDPSRVERRKTRASELFKKLHEEGKLKPYDWTGKTHSEETKKKMSKSKSGQIPWNKGKTKFNDTRLMELSKTNSRK